MNTRRFLKNDGFTLMELLIVIVILGFLIGMIAPRLSSIIGDTVIDNVCDTNNKGMRNYVNLFLQQKNRLPNEMINLANHTATTYRLPGVSDDDPTNGAEPFAGDFDVRNDPRLYALTADDVTDIKSKFGISVVRNLNLDTAAEAEGADPSLAPYEKVTLAAGVNVAMIGDIATLPAEATWTADAADPDYPMGNPFWYGRIILGIGKHSELVTAGYIQAAALCPGGIQAADNVSYNNYCLILPRLDTTAKALNDLGANTMTFIAADDDGADATNGEALEVTIEGQDAWQFDFTCPEGHKWPDNDNDNWNLTAIN